MKTTEGMTPLTIVETRVVCGGVDTHLEVHVAAAIDGNGGVLGVESFAVSEAGYRELLDWLAAFGEVIRVGVEGTGSYGAGLARFLRSSGVEVVEVDRPNRQARHRHGKSDPLDAVAAARAALSGAAKGRAKDRDGPVEAMRVLVVARRSARRQRTATLVQMRQLCFCAPEAIRARFAGLSAFQLVNQVAALRPRARGPVDVECVTLLTLRTLAHRVRGLADELDWIADELAPLVAGFAPELLEVFGVGVDTAATLLIAAGDNPGRLRSEPAWAHLCGVAPVPASSGKVTRHRLNRGGDRQANAALHRIVLVRMVHHPATRTYVARRRAEGRTNMEIMRCLKRYVAREVYRTLPRTRLA
jgi:transposase